MPALFEGRSAAVGKGRRRVSTEPAARAARRAAVPGVPLVRGGDGAAARWEAGKPGGFEEFAQREPAAAKLLMQMFGGKRLRVPKPPNAKECNRRRRRNRRIMQALLCQCDDSSHHSYGAVARRFGVARSTLFDIANAAVGAA